MNKKQSHYDKAAQHSIRAAKHHQKAMDHMKMIKHEKKEKKLIRQLAKMHDKY